MAADILKKKCSESSIIKKENEENVPKFDPAGEFQCNFFGITTKASESENYFSTVALSVLVSSNTMHKFHTICIM